MNALEKRLSETAAKMTMQEAFIAAIFTKLPRRTVVGGTAWTNGSEFVFAEDFCEKQDNDQLFGLCLHEAMHVVCMHMWRRESRDPGLWNIATDAWINHFILRVFNKGQGYKLPDNGVRIPWVTPEMDAETIYDRLRQECCPRGGGGSGDGDGDSHGAGGANAHKGEGEHGNGGFGGTGDLREALDEAQCADMKASIMAAAKMAKACGDKSLLLDRILGGGLNASVNWLNELRALMTSSARDDYSYHRVNKRFISSGLYLPSLHSDSMGGLVIGVDTSGSVGNKELAQIAGEIHGIAEDVCPDWIEVVYCDSEVKGMQRFERGEALVLTAKGGGGTRFKPVFDYVEEMGERIATLIYLTDMCGSFNNIATPGYPVIWANVHGELGSDIPFGKEVRVYV